PGEHGRPGGRAGQPLPGPGPVADPGRLPPQTLEEEMTANDQKAQCAAKAAALWRAFTDSQKGGARIGVFPHEEMAAAAKEGYDGRELAVALMDRARVDGGLSA